MPLDRNAEEWLTRLLVPFDGDIEVNMRMAVNATTGMGMVQIEVRDPHTNELLGLWSSPGSTLPELRSRLTLGALWTSQALDTLINPDPF